jgi:hypothetical protein
VNNPKARNVSWAELIQFLQGDKTDEVPYSYDTFVCADFAEMLHNNAEKAGIRAAYVNLDLSGYLFGHAANAFYTTDRGLVYIDDTGTVASYPCSADKTVVVEVGLQYVPQSIFPCSGYSWSWEPMGTVTGFSIQW